MDVRRCTLSALALASAFSFAVGGASAHGMPPAPAVVAQAYASAAPLPLPLTPPANWLPVDTHGLAVGSLHVFAAWKAPLDPAAVFMQNINVGVERFTGDLDAYDRASIAAIHAVSPGAQILLHEKTTICTGIPAWHLIWSALSTHDVKLHYEQIYVGGDEQKFVATYTRAESQPDVEEARLAIRTLCNPVAPETL